MYVNICGGNEQRPRGWMDDVDHHDDGADLGERADNAWRRAPWRRAPPPRRRAPIRRDVRGLSADTKAGANVQPLCLLDICCSSN
jgi:hypothetical protein